MNKEEIFKVFKELVVKSHLNDNPSLSNEALKEIAVDIDERVKIDTPLSEVGLDSMKMTWIVVQFENRLDVDASAISFFELFNVEDLANEILGLVE